MFKTVDRDLAPIKKSLEAYQKLLSEFPGSRHEVEAREKIKKCHSFIAQHNLLVGQFYYRKDSYLAAAYRFESVIAQFPELEIAGDAMYHLAQSYERLGANEWAVDWLVKWAKNYPDSNHRQEGIILLAELQDEDPDLLIARLNSPTTPPTAVLPNEQNGKIQSVPTITPSPVILVSANPANLTRQNGYSASPLNRTVQATDCSVGTWCDRESPSLKKVAHESNAVPGQNGHSQPSGPTPQSSTSCSLGSWCETSTTITNDPSTPVIPPTHTTQCQVGQWCSKNS